MLCLHCSVRRVNRSRGLCWRCYYLPGVKKHYRPTGKKGDRGLGNENYQRPEPADPTDAAPGTPEKVAVMELRMIQNEALWHRDDAA